MQDQASAWPRAVIFDLDGTLVDTVEDLAAALNQTLVELGLSPHPLDAVRSMVGGGLSKLLDRALAAHAAGLDAVQQDAAVARLLELYAAKPAGQSSLYPGAAETLRDLRVAGVACGLCTNKPDAITRDLLQALGVGKAFGSILGNTAGLPKKPDPTGKPCLLGDRRILSTYQMFVIAGLDPAIWWLPPIFVFTGLPAFAGNDSGRGCK